MMQVAGFNVGSLRSLRAGLLARRELAIPVVVFAVHLSYSCYSAGTRPFVIHYLWWQFLPLDALLERPFSSLFHLHSQPPLLNALFWLIHWPAQLGGPSPAALGAALFAALSLVALVSWFVCARRMLHSTVLATVVILLLVTNPAFDVFSRLFFYTHILLAQFGVLVWSLLRWAERPSRPRLTLAMALFASIVYTRALWHPLSGLLLAMLMGAYIWRREAAWRAGLRTFLLAAAVLGALVGPWMLKNRILFNTSGFSSWLGLNFAMTPDNDLQQYVLTNGEQVNPVTVTKYYAPWQLRWFERHPALFQRKIFSPSLNDPYVGSTLNLNHYAVPALGRKGRKKSLDFIREHPDQYLRRCLIFASCFKLPSYYVPWTLDLESGVFEIKPDNGRARWHQRLYYGSFLSRWPWRYYDGLPVAPNLFVILLLLSAAVVLARQLDLDTPVGFVRLALLFFYGWLIGMAVLIDGVESPRMRWPLEPAYLILLLCAGQSVVGLARLWRERRCCPEQVFSAVWRRIPGVDRGALFVFLLLLFLFSPISRTGSDPRYALLQSETLLYQGTFQLDKSIVRPLEPGRHSLLQANGLPYQLLEAQGHIHHLYPPGSSLLSLPFVAALNAVGLRAHERNWKYHLVGDQTMQRGIASMLMALLGVLIYAMSRRELPVFWSLLIALAATLGTTVWSNFTRALWMDTWGILLLLIAILQLLALERGDERRLRGLALGLLAALLFAVKPTYSIDIALISLFLLFRHRRQFWPYAAVAGGGLSLFVAYSWYNFGALLPKYYTMGQELSWEHLGVTLAGGLVSPSRGLLVFSPWLIWLGWLALRQRRALPFRPLCLLAAISAVLLLVLVSSWTMWWGGHSYGPRLLVGSTPWFALLAMCAVRALLDRREREGAARGRWRHRGALFVGVALTLASVLIHGVGAFSWRAWHWNTGMALDGEYQPLLVWNWRRPQFLEPWMPFDLVPAALPFKSAVHIVFGGPDARRFLVAGWSGSEGAFNWSEQPQAEIVWRQKRPDGASLNLRFRPFVVGDRLDRQRVKVALNGEALDSFTATAGSQTRRISLPPGLLKKRNSLIFEFPDAASPRELGVGADSRLLGIALESLTIE